MISCIVEVFRELAPAFAHIKELNIRRRVELPLKRGEPHNLNVLKGVFCPISRGGLFVSLLL